MSRAVRLAGVTVFVAVAGGLSCGGDATAPLVPTTLRLSTQSVALDAIGATQAITATVLDQNGVVIPHPVISWSSSVPGVASVSAAGLTTALANGVTVITAHIAALSTPATVTVQQVAVAPQKVSGDLQSAAAGSALPQPVKVKIADRLGNAIAGQAVTFAVTQGAGSTATPNVTSAADGTASTNWTIGTNAAVANQVTATVTGVSTAATFTATTLAGPPVGISFGTGLPTVDLGGVAPVTAVVQDRFGNAIPGAVTTLTSRNPTILAVSPTATMTGIGRGQTVIVATATSGTTFTDSTVAVVRTPGGPVLGSSLTGFSLAHDTTLTVSVVVNFGTPAARLASGAILVSWNPAVLHYVSSAAGAAGSTFLNSANGGAGSIALAFADGAGFFGNIEVARITFQVASTTGASTALAVGAFELSGNNFSDLVPNLVQVIQPVVIR